MKQVLVLGAGKSSSHLIQYLAEHTIKCNYQLLVLDINTHLVPENIRQLPNVQVLKVTNTDIQQYDKYIAKSTITISMLPAFMHIEIAKMCLVNNSHLITPSYISPELLALDEKAKANNLIFLNEMGFDPGIDHMTTLKISEELTAKGAELYSYKSYAGGLVAKKNDNNPWHYKFSWNPRNVILAGQGGDIKFKSDKEIKTLTYGELFAKSERVSLSNGMVFDAYANRDSLKYESLYHWHHIDTLLRGTFRYEGFCNAWNILIELGLTDNTKKSESWLGLSYKDFYQRHLSIDIEHYLSTLNNDLKEKLDYIGFLDSQSKITINGTSAEILQSILEEKWKLEKTDTDWVVMAHFFEYRFEGKQYKIESYLSLEGEDAVYTAMSKTVGMPIAFAAIMILDGKIKQRGVIMPNDKTIYEPILSQLESIGIQFKETTHPL